MTKWIDVNFILLWASALIVGLAWYHESYGLSVCWSFAAGATATRWHVVNFESD